MLITIAVFMLVNFVLNEVFDHLNKHAVVKDSSGHQPMLMIKNSRERSLLFLVNIRFLGYGYCTHFRALPAHTGQPHFFLPVLE